MPDASDQTEQIARALALLDKDAASALRELTRLADQGWSHAMYNIAVGHEIGAFGMKDYELAEIWYERAFNAGSRQASFQRAHLYKRLGRIGDAVEEFERGAAAGYTPSMGILGNMYLGGRRVARDLKKAEYWWQRAVARGNVIAMRDYGLAMARGKFGLNKVLRGILLASRGLVVGLYFAGKMRSINSERFS